MQGPNETDARAVPQGAMPAHKARRFYRRYAQTLLAVTVPAMVAGMVTGFLIADPKRNVDHVHDLAQRAEMLRYAQTKILVSEPVRVSAVHAPVSDLDLATR